MAVIFETERLIVRELHEADRPAFKDLVCNPAVMRYITGQPMTPEAADEKFSEYLACQQQSENTFHVWAADRKSDGKTIGTAALIIRDPDIDHDLGYRLRQEFWGSGYGVELALGLAHHAFAVLNWPYVTADVDWDNSFSIAILENFMTRTGSEWLPSENCGVHYYRCNREAFRQHQRTQ